MTISWIVFTIIFLFCVYRGYRQGIFGVLSRLLGLFASYAIAILYYENAAQWLRENTTLQGMVAYVVGGISLFFIASLVFSGLFLLMQKFFFNRWRNSTFSVTTGAAVGLVLGVFWGMLAVFTLSYVSDVVRQKQGVKIETKKNYIEIWAHQLVGKIIEKVATKAEVEPTVAKLGVALVKEPQKVMQQLQSLSNNSDVKALFSDPYNQSVLRNAEPGAIARLPEFEKLIKNPEFRELMSTAGIQDKNPTQYEQEVAAQIGDVWQRLDAVKADARVAEILSDDNFKRQLQSQNPSVILSDKRFMELVSILFATDTDTDTDTDTEAATGDPQVEINNNTGQQASPKVIYEWTDDQGQKHYSDQEPK